MERVLAGKSDEASQRLDVEVANISIIELNGVLGGIVETSNGCYRARRRGQCLNRQRSTVVWPGQR